MQNPYRRNLRSPRLLTVLLVALSLLPTSFAWSDPAPVEAAPALVTNPTVSPGGAFGNAQPCLAQADRFATTLGANNLFFPTGSQVTSVTAQALPALKTVTPTGYTPYGTLGQLGAVHGIAYDDGLVSGRERLFVSAFTRRLTGYGPAGAGGVYVFTRAGAGWAYMTSFVVPGATAATHTNNQADPSDKSAIAGVGKTSLGDMEVSHDGRTLYIVNIGPRRIERYDLTAPTDTPTRQTPIAINFDSITSSASVWANLYPFALEMVPQALNNADPLLVVGVTDTAERGVGSPNYTVNANFTVSPTVHVLGYNIATGAWWRSLSQDVGNTPNDRHEGSQYIAFANSWGGAEGHYTVKGWNPWRNNLSQLPEREQLVHYPQPWLTDIEFLSNAPAQGAPTVTNVPFEMALGLRDRTGDLVFNSYLDDRALLPVPSGELGAISQGDIMIYRFNGSAWVLQGERLDDNTHSLNSSAHYENHIGALASAPNEQTGVTTNGESVGATTLGGLGTQEMRYFKNASGASVSGAITNRSNLITAGTHAATKAAVLGDMEYLCSYALVGGRVWNDANYDGIQNTGEVGVPGIALEVVRPTDWVVLANATTDANGRYLFAVPPNTSFHIRLSRTKSGAAITGYRISLLGRGTETTDSDMAQAGGVIPFVRQGESTTFAGAVEAPVRESEGRSYDIGLTRTLPQGSIGDRVWLDFDGDGVQESGERGYQLPGTVTLRALSVEPGVVNRTTTVDTGGFYFFEYVVPGTYEIVFPTLPEGYRIAPPNRGGNDAFDSDVGATFTAGPVVVLGDELQDQWDFGVVSGADVSIAKAAPPTVAAGGLITYTLTARNLSADTAPGVVVTDTLPTGLTFVSAAPAPSSRSGQRVVWSLGHMLANSSRDITLVAQAPATLTPPAALAQDVENCVEVGIPTYDPNLPNNSDCATSTVQRPEVGITKTVPDAALVGDELPYTLVITSDGAIPADGVVVSDELPAGLTFVRFEANPLGCTAMATAVSCPASTLAPGESRLVRFIVRSEPATVAGSVTNTATVSTSSPGDAPGNNSSSGTTAIQRPDLGLTLRLDPRPLPVGEPGSLIATYGNTGAGLARSTVLTLTLEPGAEVGPPPGSCVYTEATRQAVCALGELPPGATGTLTLPLRLSATPLDSTTFGPDSYGATGEIGAATHEAAATLADNTAADTVEVVRPNVYVTATGPDDTARLSWGSAFPYVIGYGNRYAANPALTRLAAGSVLTATLPADVTFVHASVPPSSRSGQTLIWELGDLDPLATGELRVIVRANVPAGTTLHLDAEIGTVTPGDDPRDNRAGVDTVVLQPPPVVPDADGDLRLAIHSDLDPKHGGANESDGVYLTPPGATRIAWPTGEVLDFTPRLERYVLPDPGWPLEYRARVTGWGLSAITNNGRATAATGRDSRGVSGCRGGGGPVASGSVLEGCAYDYVGALSDGRTLDSFLPTVTALREAEMETQAHVYWTQPPAPQMRPDVYLFTLAPLSPPRLSVAVEVEVWVVNTCPDILVPPYMCGVPTEMPTPRRDRRAIDATFDVTLVVPRSVVGPAGP